MSSKGSSSRVKLCSVGIRPSNYLPTRHAWENTRSSSSTFSPGSNPKPAVVKFISCCRLSLLVIDSQRPRSRVVTTDRVPTVSVKRLTPLFLPVCLDRALLLTWISIVRDESPLLIVHNPAIVSVIRCSRLVVVDGGLLLTNSWRTLVSIEHRASAFLKGILHLSLDQGLIVQSGNATLLGQIWREIGLVSLDIWSVGSA